MFKMPVRRQQSTESSGRSNEGFIFIRCGKNSNTVQTSWRPQLPLPKEEHADVNENIENSKTSDSDENIVNKMERLHGKARDRERERENAMNTSSQLSNVSGGGSSSKKWSFGRLFRRKKDIETESSSEEDRKAGFQPTSQKYRQSQGSGSSKANKTKSNKNNRSSKITGAGFDHIIVNQPQQQQQQQQHYKQKTKQQHYQNADNEFFLPVETIPAHDAYYQTNQQQFLQQQQQPLSRSFNSLDRNAMRSGQPKSRSTQRLATSSTVGDLKSSSEEELISLHSSTFSKYRSDESIHSGGQAFNGFGGQSRRSRAARNERYYKRLSRDGETSHGQVPVMYAPQPSQRWKTQPVPLSIYNGPPNCERQQPATSQSNHFTSSPRLHRGPGSLQHVAPYVQWGQMQQQQEHQAQLLLQQQAPKNLQNSVTENKRSISYDSHIHLQNANGRVQTKVLPPPPPPRDPLRRVNMSGQYNSQGQLHDSSSNDHRPLSYAFDQHGTPIPPGVNGLKNRCVSDDKIWASHMPRHYQSAHSLNIPSTGSSAQSQMPHQPGTQSRRFITRAERDAQPGKKSLPNGLDFHYIADAMPRSRKPIHMLKNASRPDDEIQSSSGIVRTTKSGLPTSLPSSAEFWKSMEEYSQRKGRDFERTPIDAALKPRSISSSRVGELCGYTVPVYSEVLKPNSRRTDSSPNAGGSNAVNGSHHMKAEAANENNYAEIRRHKNFNKSSSMPQQQRNSGELVAIPNKYEEYVAEKRQQYHKPIFHSPTPLQRKLSIPPEAPPVYYPHKKPANLEEAINELEAIYRSLGLTEPPEQVQKQRVPTPVEFEKYALAHADEYDEEDSPGGEPDPVRDDVALRNIQLANLQHKAAEKQPPFGIPIGPIVPSPQNDYLHVTPKPGDRMNPLIATKSPDIVKDDLAVRALRKDPPGSKEKFIYPSSTLQKKNRATRTQSANIYSLIQRDAAKPSGGDLSSFLELTRSIERSGSMSNLANEQLSTDDVPSTLTFLRNLKAQEEDQSQVTATNTTPKKSQIPFRHPSQGGAICQLPTKLIGNNSRDEDHHKPPVPLPRKSLTPEPSNANYQMEDALNKIAKDAQESSVKLTKELQELRREALITASRPKPPNPEEERLEKELKEIEAVSEAAKRCGKMLLETLPDANEDLTDVQAKPRKLYKEGKLIKAIDQVSEAANAVCEKILKDIVTTEPPVIVHEAVKVKNKSHQETLVMPKLIKKLDPIQSEKIEAIAKRCMRQLSELADSPDYDNLANAEEMPTKLAPTCNKNPNQKPILDAHVSTSSLAEVSSVKKREASKQPIEEIDKIMQECEEKARAQQKQQQKFSDTAVTEVKVSAPETDRTNTNPTTTTSNSSSGSNAPTTASSNPTSSFSSSSDCLAKSSSPSASRRQSSSITSFNPYSSSDYIKSPSSEYHAPSTDPIKTFSTTSYDVQSTSATPNITTNSTFSYSPSPSPPLNLTPVSGRKNLKAAISSAADATDADTDAAAAAATATVENTASDRARSSSPSQYNSSEELAMIFGIEERPRKQHANSKQQQEMQQQDQQKQEQQQKQKEHKKSEPELESATVATTMQSSVSGNVGPIQGLAHQPNVSLSLPLPLSLPLSISLLSSSNHASSCALPPTSTNPNAACKSCYSACQYQPSSLRTTKTITKKTTITTNTSDNSNKIDNTNTTTTTTKPNSFTNTYRCHCSCSCIPNSLGSPNNCKLETIHEHHETSVSEAQSGSDSHIRVKLSPNFNKVYASEISIIIDKNSPEEAEYGTGNENVNESESPCQLSQDTNNSNSSNHLTRCDSLSSSEDTSSIPDSGNVSWAEFPLAGSTNASLHLQSPCNSRFEVRNTFITEVCIKRENENSTEDDQISCRSNANPDFDDFPRLPTAQELANSLKEANHASESISCTDPLRKVVYETPKLNICISEFRLNYETNNPKPTTDNRLDFNSSSSSSSDNTLLEQIAQCNAEVEKLSQVLKQMPKRRSAEQLTKRCTNNNDNDDIKEENDTSKTESSILSSTRHGNVGRSSTDDEPNKVPSNVVVSVFGETRPGNGTALTTIEHVLMACSLGVISSNDLFTLFLIIIGIVTIFAIVLC